MVALVWGIFIIIVLVIQAVFIPLISIKGIKPDLLLVITVSAGLLYGKETGFCTGFFIGLLQDLASGNVFGLNLISKIVVGYGFGVAEGKVFKDNVFLPVIAVALASIISSILVFIFVTLQGYFVDWNGVLIFIIIPTMLYNMVVSIPVHSTFSAVIRKVNQHYK